MHASCKLLIYAENYTSYIYNSPQSVARLIIYGGFKIWHLPEIAKLQKIPKLLNGPKLVGAG